MGRWTDDEDARLREYAKIGLTAAEAGVVLDRSESACAGRARRLDVAFNSAAHTDLRLFVAKGGRLVREDIGGVVGVRWARAHRSGPGFATPICEQFLTIGLLEREGGEIYRVGAARR